MRRLLRHLALANLRGGIATITPGGGTTRVACFGDSITRGVDLDSNIAGGLGPYPNVLGNLLGASYLVDNHGVGGETTTAGSARLAANVIGKGYGVVVILEGVNDLNSSEDDAATILARLRGMYASAIADGMRVVALTILPYGGSGLWSSAKEARRRAVNDGILASTGVTAIDLEATFSDGDAVQPRLKAAFDIGDGLHVSQAGATQIATSAAPSFA